MLTRLTQIYEESPPEDLSELVTLYHNTLKTAIAKHAPMRSRTMVVRPRVPWYNDEIQRAKRERRIAGDDPRVTVTWPIFNSKEISLITF